MLNRTLTVARAVGFFLFAFPMLAAIPSSIPAKPQQSSSTASGGPDNAARQGAGEGSEIGIPVDHAGTVTECVRCHAMDDEGRMSRISYVRKTPEGWQMTVRRMVVLNDAELEPEVARDIVRYLSDKHGLAPEEARPGLFEAERRVIDLDYEDDDTEVLCIQCHSMGRVITQRRTAEEWGLLVAMHRGYYPFVDFQGNPGFRRRGPARPGPDGEMPDSRHPMDKAIAHLAATFPLETDEWTAWSANRRPPRLAGTWAVAGYAVGRGPLFGTVEIAAVEGDNGAFTTTSVLTDVRDGSQVRRTGRAVVYTGFQWRGSSASSGESESSLREVMFLERDRRRMTGRWFTGAYDEVGIDVTLYRGDVPQIVGVFPASLPAGSASRDLTIHGIELPSSVEPDDLDFGPGVTVTEIVAAGGASIRVRASVAADAAAGSRDLFVVGIAYPEALVVYDKIDALRVTPEAGMARLGGVVAPKQYAQFEAIGVSYGADGEPGTTDDLDLGALEVTWSVEEYAATFDDDDIEFVGSLDANGLFTPAEDGPNPDRSGNRNNVGDVWVVASYRGEGMDRPLRGRAHLVVTVPRYILFRGEGVGR